MGKADVAVNRWLEDNERFASLCNGVVFGGQQVIKPEELENLDRETDILLADKGGKTKRQKEWSGAGILLSAGRRERIWQFWPVNLRIRSIMPCRCGVCCTMVLPIQIRSVNCAADMERIVRRRRASL